MEPFDLKKWKGFLAAGGSQTQSTIIDDITTDSRLIHSPNSLFVALPGTHCHGSEYLKSAERQGARFAIVPEDIPNPITTLQLLKVKNPLRALQEIASLYRFERKAQVIAITGSRGKTLCKDLLTAIARKHQSTAESPGSFNSQLGAALSLLKIQSKDRYAFIEAGISSPGEMTRLAEMIQPDAAIFTHLGTEHIEVLGTQENILKEKIELLKSVPKDGWTLSPTFNPSIPLASQSYRWDLPNQILPHVSLTGSNLTLTFPDGRTEVLPCTNEKKVLIDQLNIASKAAWILGIPQECILETIAHYCPEPMRVEQWRSKNGLYFINGAYCSHSQHIDQTLYYLSLYPQDTKKFFLFGGGRESSQLQSIDYRKIAKECSKKHIHHILLYGQNDFSSLTQPLTENDPNIVISKHETLQEAINSITSTLRPGDLIAHQGPKKIPFETLSSSVSENIGQNQCLIHLPSIQSNLLSIRKKLTSSTQIMVMVKAFAYGTDALVMTRFLSSIGIKIFGVSLVEEGVTLRKSGVKDRIFVLHSTPQESDEVIRFQLEAGVSDLQQIHSLEKAAKQHDTCALVHLHIDTGMGRLGCSPQQALELAKVIEKSPSLKLQGVMTHFSCADQPHHDDFTIQQSQLFDQIISDLKINGIHPIDIHASNSSAALRFSFPQYNMARIGLALFGLPVSNSFQPTIPLKPALSLLSKIAGINHCTKGQSISYGRKYSVKRAQERIGVLPIGYFDGLHRIYSGNAEVMIEGQKSRIVGNICMDYSMIDLTEITEAKIGDPVLIFGNDSRGNTMHPIDLAERGGSIVHELITCLGPRIQRVFIGD